MTVHPQAEFLGAQVVHSVSLPIGDHHVDQNQVDALPLDARSVRFLSGWQLGGGNIGSNKTRAEKACEQGARAKKRHRAFRSNS